MLEQKIEQLENEVAELSSTLSDTNQHLSELVATLDNLTRWYMEVNGYNANPRDLKNWGKKKQICKYKINFVTAAKYRGYENFLKFRV